MQPAPQLMGNKDCRTVYGNVINHRYGEEANLVEVLNYAFTKTSLKS